MSWTPGFLDRNRRERRPMAGLTTFCLGGPAEVITLDHREDLSQLCGRPLRLLGRGANLLVGDAGVDETVVVLGKDFTDLTIHADGDVSMMTIGMARELTTAVSVAAVAGLAGLEALAGIPGTMGGALLMNAGGAGWGVLDLVESVDSFDLATGWERHLSRSDLRPAYRDGGFTGDTILLSAVLRLTRDDPVAVRERTDTARRAKAAKQPLCERSAGCFFRNPAAGVSAGRLLDELGCKGRSHGGAVVSRHHANFITNQGGATTADVLALADTVRELVWRERGIVLEPEVRTWGCSLTPVEEVA